MFGFSRTQQAPPPPELRVRGDGQVLEVDNASEISGVPQVMYQMGQRNFVGTYPNPGGAWMSFLAKWRKTHAKPHSLKEAQKLMHDAGVAYRGGARNPTSPYQNPQKSSAYMNPTRGENHKTLLYGTVAVVGWVVLNKFLLKK